jgi:alpha-D-ribose 1-methylphosphonate 5-triphosphate synthase subunit PhnG
VLDSVVGDPSDSSTRRVELLAVAEVAELVELSERVLARPGISDELAVLHRPETGTVVLQVREPVCRERFYLGEVVVTRAEVAIGDARGWAMRMGTDRVAALAAAICDAIAETTRADWRDLAAEVESLCARTSERHASADSHEWAELAPTAVSFEALD